MPISFKSVVNKPLARYAFAVATVVASFLFRFALVRYFDLEFPPFMTFFPAVIFVAVLAGFWPGMLASALIVSGIVFLLLPPIGSSSIAAPRDAIAVAMFAVISVFLNLLIERFRRSERLSSSYKEEQAREKSELQYRTLFNTIDEGFCIIEMVFNRAGKPVDYRFLEVNAVFEIQTGLHGAAGKQMRELVPSIEEHWFEIFGKVALTGEPTHFFDESRALNRHYEVRAYRVGEPAHPQVAVVFSDITERKWAEEELRESERRYSALFANKINAIAHCRVIADALGEPADCLILNINEAYERVIGMKRTNVEGRRVKEVFPGVENLTFDFIGILGRVGLEGGEIMSEASLGSTGQTFSVYAYSPGPGEFIAIFTDITERKRAEEVLREREKQFHTLANSIPQLCWMANPDGLIFWYNQRWYEYTGTSSETMESLGWRSVVDPEALPTIMAQIKNSIDSKSPFEMTFPLKGADGVFHSFLTRVVPIFDTDGQVLRWFGTDTDISDKVRAAERIRQLNRVYSVLSEINQTIIREKDSQAMVEAACRIAVDKGKFRMAWIGMIDTSAQMLKCVASSGFADGYLAQVKVDLLNSDPTAGPIAHCAEFGEHAICNDIEHELLRPWRNDAIEKGYRSVAAFPLRCEETLVGVFTLYASEPAFFDGDEAQLLDELAADISHGLTVNRLEENRKKAEAELRWQTAFLRAQVDSSLDGVLVVGVDGKKILQNKRMNEMLKIPPHISEDPNDTPQLTFVTQMMKNPDQFLEKVTYLAAHPEIVGRDELELVDGSILERYSYPVMDVAGSNFGRIWTFRDITERRRLEDHFRQVQKMEAIGQLTGGIAHDFNNLLAVIIGNLDLLERQINDNEPAAKRIRTARDASFRGADLTRRLLAFARRETLQPKEIDLNAVIGTVLELATPALGPKIQVVTRLDPSTPAVFADASGLENALLNLVVNARDAMMKGGTLTITSEVLNLDSDQHSGIERELRLGGYAYVTVSDTGQGMTKEIAEKVFEPFFTTKSQGTGLGLAMVWGFIKQSGGTVQVVSEPGCGTTFSFFLRLAEEVVKLHSVPILEAQSQDAAGSTILVVDDEDGLLEIASSCLGELGYTILTAGDGTSAKRLIEERDDIALLLTDIIMPGEMTGVELAEYAIKVKPYIRIIYCSGFPTGALKERDITVAEGSLLRKPYQRSELISIVRKALESVRAGAKARNSTSNTTS
jgi:PAS domain S-box-containing protein